MVRNYRDSEYDQFETLHQYSEWFGSKFAKLPDSRTRLAAKIADDYEVIVFSEQQRGSGGCRVVIEDARATWPYRFVVIDNDQTIADKFYDTVLTSLKTRGHHKVRRPGVTSGSYE